MSSTATQGGEIHTNSLDATAREEYFIGSGYNSDCSEGLASDDAEDYSSSSSDEDSECVVPPYHLCDACDTSLDPCQIKKVDDASSCDSMHSFGTSSSWVSNPQDFLKDGPVSEASAASWNHLVLKLASFESDVLEALSQASKCLGLDIGGVCVDSRDLPHVLNKSSVEAAKCLNKGTEDRTKEWGTVKEDFMGCDIHTHPHTVPEKKGHIRALEILGGITKKIDAQLALSTSEHFIEKFQSLVKAFNKTERSSATIRKHLTAVTNVGMLLQVMFIFSYLILFSVFCTN